MNCVFDLYEHPNGGCIFADPSVFEELVSGGKQFFGALFTPLTELIEKQIQVTDEVVEYVEEIDTDLIIDGEKYAFVREKTPKEILYEYPDTDFLLDKAVEKMGVTRRKAKKELYNQVIEALKKAENVKESVFSDDEQIVMILVATDDI